MKTEQKLLTVREVAMRLSVSEKTVRREIKSGNLAVLRLGPARRRIAIAESEVTRYLMVGSL